MAKGATRERMQHEAEPRALSRFAAGLAGVLLAAAGCTSAGESGEGAGATQLRPEAEAEASDRTGTNPDGSVVSQPSTTVAPFEPEADETIVAYETDFESPRGAEWTSTATATTPSGDRTFLGPFGEETVLALIGELDEHAAVTVAFDLYVMGDWQGRSGRTGPAHRWQLLADRHEVVSTTFSNARQEQDFPDRFPYGTNAARVGAAETETLGYASSDGPITSDSVYRVEQTFLHEADELQLEFEGRDLDDVETRSWGIANLVVSLHQQPDLPAPTALEITLDTRSVSVTGTVPTEQDKALLEAIVSERFTDRTGNVDLVVEPGVAPLWLSDIDTAVAAIAPFEDLSLSADGSTAVVTGTVRTVGWGDFIDERLTRALGPDVAVSVEVEHLVPQELVEEIESLRVNFDSGSSELDDSDHQVLDVLVGLLADNEQLVLRLEGHTDTVGEIDMNKELGEARAIAAWEYLESQGADVDRVDLRSVGLNDPEVQELSDADRAVNRRVAVRIPRG